MTWTGLALYAGAFAAIFAPPLSAQAPTGVTALLGQGGSAIRFTGDRDSGEVPVSAAERTLLGRASGLRLRLEPDDRPRRDRNAASRGLLGR
jgi:hypothetical protein